MPESFFNFEVLKQYENFDFCELKELIFCKEKIPCFLFADEKKYKMQLLEFCEKLVLNSPNISDEAMSIIAKMMLVEIFHVYNQIYIPGIILKEIF